MSLLSNTFQDPFTFGTGVIGPLGCERGMLNQNFNNWNGLRTTFTNQPEVIGDSYGTHKDHVWTFSSDVLESDVEYIVLCELPGVLNTNLDVTIENNILTIKAMKGKPIWLSGIPLNTMLNSHEIGFGTAIRRFTLPGNVKQDTAKTVFRDGMLCVRFPKNVEAGTAARKLQIIA